MILVVGGGGFLFVEVVYCRVLRVQVLLMCRFERAPAYLVLFSGISWISILSTYLTYTYLSGEAVFSSFSFDSSLIDIPLLSGVQLSGCIIFVMFQKHSIGIVSFVYLLIQLSILVYSIIKICHFQFNEPFRQFKIGFFIMTMVLNVLEFLFVVAFLQQKKKKGLWKSKMISKTNDPVVDSKDSMELLLPPSTEENQNSSSLEQSSVWKILQLLKPYLCLLFLATVALFGSAGFQMSIPHLFGQMIDIVSRSHGEESHKWRDLNSTAISLMIFTSLGSVLAFFRGVLFAIIGEKLVAQLRVSLYTAILRQEIGFFDENRTGELINRLSADTTVIQDCLTGGISMGLRNMAQIIVCLIVLWILSWKLTLVMLSVIPLVSIGTVLYARFIRKISRDYQDALAEATTVSEETISNIRTVRSFGMENKEIGRYQTHVNISFLLGKKKAFAFGIFVGGIGQVAYSAIILVLWYGSRLVLEKTLTPGNLTSFMLYTIYIATAVGGLSSLFSSLMGAVGSSDRIFHILKRLPSINTQNEGIVLKEYQGGIRFENCMFAYPSRKDIMVIQHFSLKIQPKQTVAIVGSSGHGKSTLVNLLERFYAPDSGCIYLDDTPLHLIDPKWLRSTIALVSQEPILFATSIKENIAYSNAAKDPCKDEKSTTSTYTIEQVESAAKQANAHDFIQQFPNGYDTIVGERGVQLSGGQKQRIAIARALLMSPKVLLLDEATSALDTQSEGLVQEALDRAMTERTVLIIAHRLSTVRNADVIVVVENGQVVDQGKHDDLLGRCQKYQLLVKSQLVENR